ncbi:leucine-rich repeat receptor-like serine/threonine-protein kinase BAM1 [Oryza sativa Japonica Group]|uniref:non-specific serine/threonine protein kinase n=4 Tax=Oryza TaxID=4527 RepID=Q53ME4_ORYSJ|nr:leucine-rich repeat receptor-like serine/threonine-protein kinase BAM1 [Oryza sativa Japonica Group]AAX96206.1 Similar to receptor-like protein kinase 3 [Oryza sativa Japonica Group]ABA92267.1 Leucine Rich Repeat family protein, expressed [Oryza sativa Japonica Group]BAT13341.1 Os11g0233800 [Oryza sativa Japonica Group]
MASCRRPAPLRLVVFLAIVLLRWSTNGNATAGGDDALRGDALALVRLRASLRCHAHALRDWSAGNVAAVCAWTGVRCAGGRVVSVDVANMNVSTGAPVSAAVAGLDALANLSLAGNGIVGAVTASALPALRFVNVSGNQLGGGLDGWDFASLPSLEVFDAYDNNFSSPLPAGVVALRRLRYLDLGGNFFSGEIPAAYGGMAALEYLSLNGNNLQGAIPPELGNLTSLRELYLGYYNVFDGGIPPELGRLRNLTMLDISNCGLSGRIPPELGALAALDTLFLHTNQLSGAIPPELGNLTALTALDLSNNALTGEVPATLASLTSLRLLNLFLNRLHGPVPDFVAALPRLETVQLFMNNLTGRVPAGLGANAALRLVDISSNRLTGMVPEMLCASGELHTAILMNNFLFGPIPASLGSCSSLTRVRLGQNYLNGTIPAGLLYLPRLNLLELQNNLLSGDVPANPSPAMAAASQSSQLAQLNLSSNQLSGPLPSSIANLTALQTLLVSNNRLAGAVPPEVGELRRLVKLDLSGNALSGTIPAAIGRCGELTYLDLSKNNLSGAIPEAIAGVRVLNYLNLSRNQLEEAIPAAIGAMSSLTAADFSYNDLSGELPDAGQLGYLNATAFAGNPRLCGPLLGRPCGYGGGGAAAVGAGGSSSAPVVTTRQRAAGGDFKLVLALGLLVCSVVFAAAAVLRARSCRGGGGPDGGGAWRFTAFHKVDFGIAEVIESMKDGNVVGRGGAGVVYVGRTRSGGSIAVKRLNTSSSAAAAGGGEAARHDHGFRAEIRTLGSIRHRNIVRLLAFCSRRGGSGGGEAASSSNVLVYEYMANGSLGEVLHGKGGGFLSWDRRYRIAVEAARGLCYLHHDCSPMIVHRDVKSNNILLGDNFEAHVADFGLAKFLRSGGGATASSECMSAVAGSYGYIAPEYAYTLRVDEKSDVYSYGVVLLELITGRRPVGDFGEGVDIVQWTKRVTDGRRESVHRIIDRRISTVPMDEVAHIFFVSMLCVQENSVERPTMREVVQMLSEFPRHGSDQPSPSSSAPETGEESSPEKEPNCYKLFPDLLT